MDSRKFFQSYELSSLEEAYVVLKNFIVGFYGDETGADGVLDEAIYNVFIEAEDSLSEPYKSILDSKEGNYELSQYVLSSDIARTVYSWIDLDSLSDIKDTLSDDFNEEDTLVELYDSIVGDEDLTKMMERDKEIQGDVTNWYDDDPLFKEFKRIASEYED